MSKKRESLEVGFAFIKAGDRQNNVWIVDRIWTHVDGLLYANLKRERNQNDVITVSVSTLVDRLYWRRVEHAAAA